MQSENNHTTNNKSPFRDEFKIEGFRFGSGKPVLAIVGALRGDEVQQQFICAQMVSLLQRMEAEKRLAQGIEILVIPNANHFSMNIEKRFWAMDSTDINRMFPGYNQGETTQRIAAALFEQIKEYPYGIQLASYYLPGDFIPHIRMMETGYQPEEEACWFGLPYAYIRHPRPYDTTVLNYNWQIWGCKAFMNVILSAFVLQKPASFRKDIQPERKYTKENNWLASSIPMTGVCDNLLKHLPTAFSSLHMTNHWYCRIFCSIEWWRIDIFLVTLQLVTMYTPK